MLKKAVVHHVIAEQECKHIGNRFSDNAVV